MIKDLLSVEAWRKALLGFAAKSRPTESEIARDAGKAVQFARSEEYQVWAEEAWASISVNLQKALEAKTEKETNVSLGAVKGAMELLSISLKARREYERLSKEISTANNATSRR